MTLDAFEINPASPWCQRWDKRRHSWRHRSEGGFRAEEYSVEALDEIPARDFVTGNHYSGTYPVASKRYALRRHDELVGVAVYGIPVQKAVLTNAFPGLEPYSESLELSRFVLADEVPGNAETWFLARTFTELLAEGVRGIVSFADPVPRRIGNEVVSPGHVGTIYQAAGASHRGRGRADTVLVLRDGSVLNRRSMSKVRNGERGAEYVQRRLMSLGAPTPRGGETGTAWLERALDELDITRLRHRGCHRYLFPLGTNARARARIEMGFEASANYPKTVDHEQAGAQRRGRAGQPGQHDGTSRGIATPLVRQCDGDPKRYPVPTGAVLRRTTPRKGASMSKAPIQYYRNGNPITNPSMNKLSGIAYFYTRGIDDLPRVTTERLSQILADLGVTDPRAQFDEVELPNGTRISATVGRLAPVSSPKVRARAAEAAKSGGSKRGAGSKLSADGQARLDRVEAMRKEGAAVKAWEDGGKVGRRPETPVCDAHEATQREEAAKRAKKANQTAHKATVKPMPAKRSGRTSSRSKSRAAS